MTRNITRWANSVRERNLNVIVETLPWRERVRLYGAVGMTRPSLLVSYFQQRFMRWAPMLGDRWIDFQRNVEGIVVRCRPDEVVLEVASKRFIEAFGYPWETGYPHGAIPAFETVALNDPSQWRWMIAR